MFCQLLESKKVSSQNNEDVMTDAYRLSPSGVTLALISKAQNDSGNSKFYDDIYLLWNKRFDEEPQSSLDLFCKRYISDCKDSTFFDNFIKIYAQYFFDRPFISRSTDLFTRMIFFRFDNDESKNEKLFELWKNAWLKVRSNQGLYITNHITTYIHRQIEKKVRDFSKFEDIRYENRSEHSEVVIEASCRNCPDEYIYRPVPLVLYLPYLFYDKVNAQIFREVKLWGIKCQRCNNSNFSFILI